MVEAARQGGGVAAVYEAAGTTELPPPLTWLRDTGEGSPPWMRPKGRQTVAALVEDTERGGGDAALDENVRTAEFPLPLTWTPVVGRGRRFEQGRGNGQGVVVVVNAVG